MKFRNYILATLIIVFSAFKVDAQNTMTLEQCREKAIEYNKSLKIAKLQEEEAIANQKTARTAYLPKVDAQGSAMFIPGVDDISMPGGFLPTAENADAAKAGNYTGDSNVWSPGMNLELGDITYYSAQIGIQLPIYTGGKIKYSNKMADLGVHISKQSFKLKYDEVIEQVDEAFWNVVAMKANVQLASDYQNMLSELEEQMTDMYDLGLAPASEKLKVAVQKNESELNLIRAKNGLRLTKMALNQVMGFNLNQQLEVPNSIIQDTKLPDFSNGIASAMKTRPELNMLQGKVNISEYDKKMVEADYLPQFGLGVNKTFSKINPLTNDFQSNVIAAAELSIPIFHWGESKHKRRAAEMQIQQAEMNLSNTRDLISLQVSQVQIQLEEAWQTIEIAKKSISEANENMEETKLSFEVGLNTTTDVLNAQAEWQKSQTSLIAAKTQFEQLKTSWLKVTGKLE